MKKKTRKNKKKNHGKSPNFFAKLNHFFDFIITLRSHSSMPLVWSLFSFALSMFMWTAIATYSPKDPSPIRYHFPPPNHAMNKSGIFGAYLSGSLFLCFGYLAWMVPIPFAWYSYTKTWCKRSPAFSFPQVAGFCVVFFSLLLTIPIFFKTFHFYEPQLPSTGIIGNVLFHYFQRLVGDLGFYIFLFNFYTCGILLLCSNRLSIFAKKFEARFQNLIKILKRDLLLPSKELVDFSSDLPIAPKTQDSTDIELNDEETPLHRNDSIFYAPQQTRAEIEIPAKKSNHAIYNFPPIDLLNKSSSMSQSSPKNHQNEIRQLSEKLEQTLKDFGVKGQIIGHHYGPVVTIIEYLPDPGIKQSKIMSLSDDMALALKVDSIMIQPLKTKSALGIQIPNIHREKVYLGDILSHNTFTESKYPLTFGLGKTIHGEPVLADLGSMPHLLIAGSTGSGKSVGVNGILCSLIMKSPPSQVKMILVDPKMLELSIYEGIPHLLMPVITDPQKASLALKWSLFEMEKRYRLMQICAVRNIESFNEVWSRKGDEEKNVILEKLKNDFNIVLNDNLLEGMPYIVIVIDELADLMMTAPKEVEISIQRLAQKARASGIHMVLATQRPSVDIITGVIKANLPCRIAYQVVSKHDSRTILDGVGAEKLLGKGDLLFQRPGSSKLERLQGALITDEEVMGLVKNIKYQDTSTHYCEEAIKWIEDQHSLNNEQEGSMVTDNFQDTKYQEALSIAESNGSISASYLQRQLKVGYNRAARMIEHMEREGLVEKSDGVKPRRWLQKKHTVVGLPS